MKHILITTIAAVVLVGCGPSVDIHEAARTGNIEVIKQHLNAGTDVNVEDNFFNRTSLHNAAEKGHKEIVELLITKGANVNAKDDNGSTPLHSADTKEIAELLIANGADVNAKDDAGWTPLDWAEPFEDDSPEDKANDRVIQTGPVLSLVWTG